MSGTKNNQGRWPGRAHRQDSSGSQLFLIKLCCCCKTKDSRVTTRLCWHKERCRKEEELQTFFCSTNHPFIYCNVKVSTHQRNLHFPKWEKDGHVKNSQGSRKPSVAPFLDSNSNDTIKLGQRNRKRLLKWILGIKEARAERGSQRKER